MRKVTATIDHLLLPYYSVKNASGFMFGRPAAFQKSVAELLLGWPNTVDQNVKLAEKCDETFYNRLYIFFTIES